MPIDIILSIILSIILFRQFNEISIEFNNINENISGYINTFILSTLNGLISSYLPIFLIGDKNVNSILEFSLTNGFQSLIKDLLNNNLLTNNKILQNIRDQKKYNIILVILLIPTIISFYYKKYWIASGTIPNTVFIIWEIMKVFYHNNS